METLNFRVWKDGKWLSLQIPTQDYHKLRALQENRKKEKTLDKLLSLLHVKKSLCNFVKN